MASRPGLLRPSREFPARHEERVRAADQPESTGLELADAQAAYQLRFLAYPFPSCSPRPAHPAVLNRRDFVEAAPALPTDPWLRLPPASPHCCDSEEMDGLSPPSATAAPRGALVLHPAPYHGIDLPGEAAHGVPGAQVQPPAAHLGTHLGQGILADRGQERG